MHREVRSPVARPRARSRATATGLPVGHHCDATAQGLARRPCLRAAQIYGKERRQDSGAYEP
ncbi:hypothetical protein GCM10022206_65180 [Streptomyces chiangmaiensis]